MKLMTQGIGDYRDSTHVEVFTNSGKHFNFDEKCNDVQVVQETHLISFSNKWGAIKYPLMILPESDILRITIVPDKVSDDGGTV